MIQEIILAVVRLKETTLYIKVYPNGHGCVTQAI